ncbi:hemin importer ATP-binding subunit [Bordetella ansorpii]|uniref:Hemin importer ATP-binding subunit n=1 Tax=Bordetella ansorpii TaxID=288768 RepID=A0A157Q6U1_9BORD|nr:PHP domain-containing protein [Bordetella ansorpii]SAI41615.1 hemin importer ATP-binding subunit [Bordetella ansorpii]
MSLLQEIQKESNGALFRRADLHIHSFGPDGSYDVTDAKMTPEAIVDTSIAERLDLIAITDHNQIGNVRSALKYAQGKSLLVVPGVELSTPQGHLLVYFETADQLQRFFGKLTISDDGKACHNTVPQCLQFAAEYNGFGICAHIELDSGLEKAAPKFDAFKQEVFNCPNLLGLEITNASNSAMFSHDDADPNRRNCAVARCAALGLEEGVDLAKVMSSDAHTLNALGRNASGNRKLTRLKMEALTFASLRIALMDATARVRLEDLIPASVPRFVGMKLEGGFLKNQIVHFSPNLTCVIGGRGAGKSTLLESLRAASGNAAESTIIDSEVWPDAISLVYEDEVGERHTLTRSKLCDVTNADPEGPTAVAIESYGQGETADTIQHCDTDPSILLRFLDGFIDFGELRKQDELLRDAILANQALIETLQQSIDQIGPTEKAKGIADTQLAALKRQNASQVVELEEKLAKERRFRDGLKRNLSELLTSITSSLAGGELRRLTADIDGDTLAVGKAEFDLVKALVERLATEIDKLSGELKQKVVAANGEIAAQLQVWVTREKATQERIEEIRRDLEKQNIKLDIAFIRKVTKDAADLQARLIELKKSQPKQQEAFKERRRLIQERATLRAKIFNARQAFATTMSGNLAAAVVDYRVKFQFYEGLLSPEMEDLIKTTMNWRTSQVPRAGLIAARISPAQLLVAVNAKNTSVLEQLNDADGNRVFSKADAGDIIAKLSEWQAKCALERIAFEDRPEIKVTQVVENADGTKGYRVRDFAKLSLGQQQAILLTVLLFSKSRVPLIIDQPEDNLDGEFIYKTVVRSLRSIKEHRQVIIVTHNANIAVLGDAELIIPLRGASEVSVIRDRGSIDTTDTKDIVCTILEGSQKAFKRRQEVYGY